MPRIDFALHPGVIVFVALSIVLILGSVATTIYLNLPSNRISSESTNEEDTVPPFVPESQRTIHHRTATQDGNDEHAASKRDLG